MDRTAIVAKNTSVSGSLRRTRNATVGGAALALAMFATSSAQASCISLFNDNIANFMSFSGSLGSMIAGSINTLNTSFLTQSSAFVGSPSNTKPRQMGGGIWGRVIGGSVDVDARMHATSVVAGGAVPGDNITCNNTTSMDYAGAQVGRDISKLNVNGWNLHWGVTAGYGEANAKQSSTGLGVFAGFPGTKIDTQAPFAGVYAAVSKGEFFADAMFLENWYTMAISSTALPIPITDQRLDARGYSLIGNAGWHHRFSNQFFVEPSLGFVYSKTEVDNFTYVTEVIGGAAATATLKVHDIKSFLGRVSLRVGTTFVRGNMAVQPFLAGSLWHEFADDNSASASGQIFFAGLPFTMSGSSTRVGTYGQIGGGAAAAIINTGWLGYARVDYRFGENIDGWGVNAGLRYQFNPPPPTVHKGIVKAPVYAAETINWTGIYVGIHGGALSGDKDWTFVGPGTTTSPGLAGWLLGGQLGFNYQVGKWVFGVEGEFSWTNAEGAEQCPNGFFVCRNEANWVATLGGRLGYSWERALMYVKAGGAWIEDNFFGTLNIGNTFAAGTGDKTRNGWMIGFGSEFAFNEHWSAKAEWQYMDFGTERESLVPVPPGGLVNIDQTVQTVKVGINYRFGIAPAPVAARY